MNHIIIFLFDKFDCVKEDVCRLENHLLSFDRKGTRVFYLEILSGTSSKFIDKFSEVVSDGSKNKFDLIDDNLNLRSTTDLKNCFTHIKNLGSGQYYFISTGHGKGFGIDRFKHLVKNPENVKWLPENIEQFGVRKLTDSDYRLRAFEILWNIELYEALTVLNPVIGIFNNCNVNYLDSLLYYSRAMRYLIGTENYLNTAALNLDDILETIRDNQTNSDVDKVARNIYNAYLVGFISQRGVPGMEKASLFLLKLAPLEVLVNAFNSVISNVLKNFSHDIDWYVKMVIFLQTFYVSGNHHLIDMIYLLNRLDLQLRKPQQISTDIQKITELMRQEIVIEKSCFDNDGTKFGVSIYLPPVEIRHFYYNAIFTEYSKEYREYLKKFTWYTLIHEYGKRLGKIPPISTL